jgi:hypothetical protein
LGTARARLHREITEDETNSKEAFRKKRSRGIIWPRKNKTREELGETGVGAAAVIKPWFSDSIPRRRATVKN